MMTVPAAGMSTNSTAFIFSQLYYWHQAVICL